MTTVKESIQDQINEIILEINILDVNRDALTKQHESLTQLLSTLQTMEKSSGQRNLIKQAISEIEKVNNFPK